MQPGYANYGYESNMGRYFGCIILKFHNHQANLVTGSNTAINDLYLRSACLTRSTVALKSIQMGIERTNQNVNHSVVAAFSGLCKRLRCDNRTDLCAFLAHRMNFTVNEDVTHHSTQSVSLFDK